MINYTRLQKHKWCMRMAQELNGRFTSKQVRDLRGGSIVKSTDCSSWGHRFGSQHPHNDSQPSATSEEGITHPLLKSVSTIHMCCPNIDADKATNPHKIKLK